MSSHGGSWIHYDPERVDYSLTESELTELKAAAQNSWKDFTIATAAVGIPCAINACGILAQQSKFEATLPFVLNLVVGLLGIVLAVVFGILWQKSAVSVKTVVERIKAKPKIPIGPLLTDIGELPEAGGNSGA